MDFKTWYEEADMPVKDQDGWYDMETGIRFKSHAIEQRVNTETLQTRSYVKKMYGANALTGTVRQKKWAETIRFQILQKLQKEDARFVANHKWMNNSKSWINARSWKATELLALLKEQRLLSDRYNLAQANKDHKLSSEIADKYNKLSSRLGYK